MRLFGTLPIYHYLISCILLSSAQGFSQNTPIENSDTVKLSSIQSEYEQIIIEVPAVVKQYTDTLLLHSELENFERYSTTFANVKSELDQILDRYISSWQIKNLESKLKRSETNFNNLSDKITTVTNQLETSLSNIKKKLSDWTIRQSQIQNDPVSRSMLPQTREVISLLRNAEKVLQQQLTRLLNIQNKINQLQIEHSDYLNKIDIAENNAIAKLFVRDANFIWNSVEQNRESGQKTIGDSFKVGTRESIEYLSENWKEISWLLVTGVALLFVFNFLKSKKSKFPKEEGPSFLIDNNITKFPVASAIITILLASFFILENRPALLSELLLVAFSIPLLIFTIGKSIKSVSIYWISFFLYCLNVILLNIPLGLQLRNIVLMVTVFATISLLLWMYKNPSRYLVNSTSSFTKYIKSRFIPFFFYLSCLTLILGVVGYVELSKLLISGILASLYIGPVVLICAVIIRNFLQTISHTFLLEDSFLVRKYFPLLIRLIGLGAFSLWLISVFRVFGLLPFLLQLFESIWNFGGTFGEYTITIGDVTGIILLIIVSFILADFIQVLLEEEIFSRVKVARGVPMAIGVMGKYLIIIIGFFLAIASTGFDLTKMSIIAGALGVGVGFGLQNLVANFVSGLILIFERPILIGDIIEAEGQEGQVTQIGIRASKILTYAGAEVVIPNSNLINNRVSNWTLSNRKRRFTIEIRTNKEADPAEIVSILTTIARNHKNVIEDPAAFVIFDGQLEQSLRFRLYYWQVGELLSTRSELNLEVYKALKERGVELSIPVYEIKNID